MDYGKVAFFLVLAVALGVGIWMLCKQAGSRKEQASIMKVQNTAHCASGAKGGVCQDGDLGNQSTWFAGLETDAWLQKRTAASKSSLGCILR